jgi:phage FluMu gp28-like protein
VARSGDLSPIWINERVPAVGGDGVACRAVIAMSGVRFASQRAAVRAAMDMSHTNVGCGDATGLGADSNEQLHEHYGDRWEPVTFTAARKRELASGLATAYSDGSQGLPPQDGEAKIVHADLYALQADRTGDRLKLVETANPMAEESHCDIAWANALAIRAGGLEGAVPDLWIPGAA